ncbi:MAG: TIGR03750 family conjugal transfer protein [Burkholderiales bacterium]|jgi:conjugative transfer region protein (TIGR03750 family)|nr:TIGR03750 family conjugal transfer protein [Burkholderiales bacterium]
MTANLISAEDGTVAFLPERLNRAPIVLRGMTNDEMFIVGGLGAALGLVLGLIGWVMTGYIAMVPTMIVFVAFAVIFFGSAILRRMKRGKPETWLYRRLQWQSLKRLGLSFGGGRITIRTGFWAVRRERRVFEAQVKK